MRSRSLLLAVLLSTSAPALPAADPVTLSRSLWKIEDVLTGRVYKFIPVSELESMCLDEDGCLVSLKIEQLATVRLVATQTRLYLSQEFSNFWTTPSFDGPLEDGDASAVNALYVASSIGGECGFSDGNNSTTVDGAVGFTLYAKSGDVFDPLTCFLMIQD